MSEKAANTGEAPEKETVNDDNAGGRTDGNAAAAAEPKQVAENTTAPSEFGPSLPEQQIPVPLRESTTERSQVEIKKKAPSSLSYAPARPRSSSSAAAAATTTSAASRLSSSPSSPRKTNNFRCTWLDAGVSMMIDGVKTVYHNAVTIENVAAASAIRVEVGHVVKLRQSTPYLIEGLLEVQHKNSIVSYKAKLVPFLNKAEVSERLGGNTAASITDSIRLARMKARDVVLGTTVQTQALTRITDVVSMTYVPPGGAAATQAARVCRYRLQTVDPVDGTALQWPTLVAVTEIKGGWPKGPHGRLLAPPAMTSKKPNMQVPVAAAAAAAAAHRRNMDTDSARSADDAVAAPAVMTEGEGSTLRADIAVGTQHQVDVGPFVPQPVRSRQPIQVWRRQAVPDALLQQFLSDLALILTPYLRKKGLVMDDPYFPLPMEATAALMRDSDHGVVTGSTFGTAANLGTARTNLLKECDADAVLALLHAHDYDPPQALVAVQGQLDSLSASAWTRTEKEIFDDNLLRSNGSLRTVAKTIAPVKSMRQVIDYHYRFKIPDQFRRYQERKREQAVRIAECIQKRRYHESVVVEGSGGADINGGTSGGDSNVATNSATSRTNGLAGRSAKRKKLMPSGGHWSETSAQQSGGVAVASRQQSAKELMLQVRSELGDEILGQVAAVVRQLAKSYDAETKDVLFSLLQGKMELQQRFLEFLPKHF